MKTIVMAGGEGTRLRPLTINCPKPMVPVANRSVMGHMLTLLKQHNLDDVVAAVQYRADDIQDYFHDGAKFGLTLHYSVEPQPLGTAGSVKFAARQFAHAEPLLIVSGDALTDINLTELIAFHQHVGAAATLALYHAQNPLEYGVVLTDADGRIERLVEKPTWGEVLSDTINTGIYVISPAILDLIEPGVACDFSKDLFPRLLAQGAPLYGYTASGYWCDIGNLTEYLRATGDLLSGAVNLGDIGQHRDGGIYIENDVQIASDAQLAGPIYLGEGVQIKRGAVIQGPTAIHPFTIVDERAHIERSIVWQNTYIGVGAELRGAIIGQHCQLKAHVSVHEGAVLGDDCAVGEGAVIHPNVNIWPRKQVEAGAMVRSSLVWGTQARRSLFGRYGVTGLVNVDLTSESVARLAGAFGATLPKGAIVTVNRDLDHNAQLLQRVIVSSLASAGVVAQDLPALPIPVARYYTAARGAAGGIHVRLSPFDPRAADIRFFDQEGYNLARSKERHMENIFFREDFRRVSFDELGRIEQVADVPELCYSEAFMKALNADAIRAAHFRLVVDYANAPTALILHPLLNELGCTVVALNERADETRMCIPPAEFQHGLDQLSAVTTAVKADVGLRIDVGGERVWWADNHGCRVAGAAAAAAFAALACASGRHPHLAVAVNQPVVFEEIAARHGAQIRWSKSDAPGLMEATRDPAVTLALNGVGEFVVPALHHAVDGMFATAKLLEWLATQQTTLAEVIAALPPYHIAQQRVPCAWEHKAGVMRRLGEQYQDHITTQVDGLRIRFADSEWVLFVCEPDEPALTIYGQAVSPQAVTRLVERHAHMAEALCRGQEEFYAQERVS